MMSDGALEEIAMPARETDRWTGPRLCRNTRPLVVGLVMGLALALVALAVV